MSASWVSIDLMDFAVQTEAAVQSPEAALKWLRSFRDTLLMGGRNVHPMPWAVELMRLADLKIVKKTVARMEGHARKMGGEGCNVENECEKRYGARYTELKKKLSADGDTRDGSNDKKSCTSADTETLDGLHDKDKQPGAERATSKPSRTTPPQNSYGEFNNVKMTTAEFEKFVQAVGAERANALIEELSSYLASSGKRYKSHYATLLNWGRRKDKESEPKKRYLTTEEISQRNIEESERQMKAILAHRRSAHG